MKKRLSVLLSTGLFTLAGSVFAADVKCPDVSQIRNSKFIFAYEVFNWDVLSQPFTVYGKTWRVLFDESDAKEIKSSTDAVNYAQKNIASIPLSDSPKIEMTDQGASMCIYTNEGAKSSVVASTSSMLGHAE